ncbi:MAG: heme A synthase [Chloroflexi bacterium]|nr:heme A synthase [Chloroflexota bacterium]
MRKPFDAYGRYAWWTLAVNLLVALGGVFVRASGSGAGCGNHWPLCYGAVIPDLSQWETVVEFTHRLTSAAAFVMVFYLWWWARRAYPSGHPVRIAAGAAFLLMITEVLAGGSLVLFDWVVDNLTWGRIVAMVVHLTNTYLLIAALATTAWLASGGTFVCPQEQGAWARWLMRGIGLIWLESALGAIVALNEVVARWEAQGGLPAAYQGPASFVRAMLPVHITLAVLLGLYLWWTVSRLGLFHSPIHGLVVTVLGAYALQLVLGVLNLWSHLAIGVQLLHLTGAYVLWLGWWFITLETLITGPAPQAQPVLDLSPPA